MDLTAHCELATKRQDELKGLYRELFNQLADKELPSLKRQQIQATMYCIQAEINARHQRPD